VRIIHIRQIDVSTILASGAVRDEFEATWKTSPRKPGRKAVRWTINIMCRTMVTFGPKIVETS